MRVFDLFRYAGNSSKKIFALKNSLGGTKSETGVGVNNDIWVNDLYEKIVDINNLKTLRLLDFLQNAA